MKQIERKIMPASTWTAKGVSKTQGGKIMSKTSGKSYRASGPSPPDLYQRSRALQSDSLEDTIHRSCWGPYPVHHTRNCQPRPRRQESIILSTKYSSRPSGVSVAAFLSRFFISGEIKYIKRPKYLTR